MSSRTGQRATQLVAAQQNAKQMLAMARAIDIRRRQWRLVAVLATVAAAAQAIYLIVKGALS